MGTVFCLHWSAVRGENIMLQNLGIMLCFDAHNLYQLCSTNYAQRICHYAFKQNKSLYSQMHLKLKNREVPLLSHAEALVTFMPRAQYILGVLQPDAHAFSKEKTFSAAADIIMNSLRTP